MTNIHFNANAKLSWVFHCDKCKRQIMIKALRSDADLEPEELARAFYARDRETFNEIGRFTDAHRTCPYSFFLAELSPLPKA